MSGADGWCAVALSADLEPGTSAGTRIDGIELVVWRDLSGRAHVWEDRCPHRGMRLSFGFVRGDRLACLYHGWQFDEAGRCRLIPAHPALTVPGTIRVTTHECVEGSGMIWTRRADPAVTGAVTGAATTAEWPAPTQAVAVRSIAIDRDAPRVRAALPGDPAPAGTIVAVQPLAPGQTMLHANLSGTPDRSLRLAVCGWAEALRDALEAGA